MKILIATKNFGKIEGAKKAFEKYFDEVEIEGFAMESGVGEQPANEDILLGAKNRVENLKKYAKENKLKADYFLAIESGIFDSLGSWFITNIAVIDDGKGCQSFGTSPSFPVPEKFVNDVLQTNLSEVMGKVFWRDDERHNYGGGIQLLTKDKVSRIDLNELAFIMALTRFLNKEWN